VCSFFLNLFPANTRFEIYSEPSSVANNNNDADDWNCCLALQNGVTALILAAREGKEALVVGLVLAKADPNRPSPVSPAQSSLDLRMLFLNYLLTCVSVRISV
jgi:hypothetical protein